MFWLIVGLILFLLIMMFQAKFTIFLIKYVFTYAKITLLSLLGSIIAFFYLEEHVDKRVGIFGNMYNYFNGNYEHMVQKYGTLTEIRNKYGLGATVKKLPIPESYTSAVTWIIGIAGFVLIFWIIFVAFGLMTIGKYVFIAIVLDVIAFFVKRHIDKKKQEKLREAYLETLNKAHMTPIETPDSYPMPHK